MAVVPVAQTRVTRIGRVEPFWQFRNVTSPLVFIVTLTFPVSPTYKVDGKVKSNVSLGVTKAAFQACRLITVP